MDTEDERTDGVDVSRPRVRRWVRRRGALVTGGAAVGVTAVIASVSLLSGVRDARPQPAASSPSPSATSPAPHVAIGRVGEADTRFGVRVGGYAWRAFDPVSDTGLYLRRGTCTDCIDVFNGFTVVGRRGPVATLTCGSDVDCPRGDVWHNVAGTLGPGKREVTVETGDREAQVLGYDGKVHRTLDLSGTLGPGENINGLAWSAQSGVLAVLTRQLGGGAHVGRLWLVLPSGKVRLAYSTMKVVSQPGSAPLALRAEDFDLDGFLWSLGGWSPDGQVLLLDVIPGTGSDDGADVVALRMQPAEAERPAAVKTLYHSDRNFDWAGNLAWSPDGTRVAVRARSRIVEISPDDGRVLAQRPDIAGWLVWPRAASG
jgi:hypothetical protein